jgi:hypothetical protein
LPRKKKSMVKGLQKAIENARITAQAAGKDDMTEIVKDVISRERESADKHVRYNKYADRTHEEISAELMGGRICKRSVSGHQRGTVRGAV